jgi:uncharacterized protein (DUF2126 family)
MEDRDPAALAAAVCARHRRSSALVLEKTRATSRPAGWRPGRANAPAAHRSRRTTAGPGRIRRQIVRTALCVEPRNGKLFVFMPPTKTLEEYLSCLGAVEDVALALDQPVVIEGYAAAL